VTQGKISPSLAAAIRKYRKSLPARRVYRELQNVDCALFRDVFHPRTVVTIQDRVGRCYVDEYIGIPARHIKVTDHFGRIRTKRGGARRLKVVTQPSYLR